MIIVIVIGTCVWGRFYQTHTIDDMLTILDEIEEANERDRKTNAEKLYDRFEQSADILACYMNHDDVDSAKSAVVALRSAVHHHSESEILSATEEARAQLEKLRNIDSVRLENVL